MKIVFVNSLYAPHFVGGAELSVQILAESMVHRGHTVHVICLAPEQGTGDINGVRVWYLRLRNFYWPFGDHRDVLSRLAWHGRDLTNFGMAEDVGRIIDQVKPDVVHSNNVTGFSVAVLGAVRAREIRLVHTLRDYYLLCLRSGMRKGNRNCDSQCLECFCVSSARRWVAAPVDFVVGISTHILNVHRNAGWFHSIPGCVIHNPVVAPREMNGKISGKVVRFGYMGRLVHNKGLDSLLVAFEQVRRSHPVELLVAGDGTPEDVARYRVMAGGVKFLGYKRPDEFFPQIDVLVVPSLWNEPFGRVVVEAFSYGIPVIASNRGGLPELITDGTNGYLFNPDDSSELRSIMMRICDDPQSAFRLSEAAQVAAARFSPDNIASAYESTYSASADH